MYVATHVGYCGMRTLHEKFDDIIDARDFIAHYIMEARANGFPVTTLTPGEEWEILEPDDCMIVPDECGVLRLRHITYECRECGSRNETKEDARACCTEDFHFDENFAD